MTSRTQKHKCDNLVSDRTAELEKAYNRLADLNSKLIKRDLEREEAQEALRESEARFRALLENNHAVMLVVDPDNGLIVDANAAAVSFYGYSAKTLLSMNVKEINTLKPEEVEKNAMRQESKKRPLRIPPPTCQRRHTRCGGLQRPSLNRQQKASVLHHP